MIGQEPWMPRRSSQERRLPAPARVIAAGMQHSRTLAQNSVVSVGRTSPTLLESHSDQLLDKRLWQRLVDREVEGALCHRVPLELGGKLCQD